MKINDINKQKPKLTKDIAAPQSLAEQFGTEFALLEKIKAAKSQLDVPTPAVSAIAKKHGVSIDQIMSQLKMGIEVELEHTTDRAVAHEIALDHLNELPDYYTRLKEVESGLNETLTKVNGRWALVSKTNPDKVLQYYRGHGKPSKEWVSKVERRVHSFESRDAASAVAADFRLKTKEKYPDITMDVFGSRSGLHVSKIEIPKEKRKLGVASDLMKSLANLGDRHQLLITLSPTNEFGASKARLIEFYKRFGFVQNKGKNKDFAISDTMYRLPSAITEGVGRITKQNQTIDVGPNEISTQAAKFGNKVTKDGYPPILDKKAAKNTTPHILHNIGLAEANADDTHLSPLVRRMVRRAKTKFPYAETDLEAVLSMVHKNTLDTRKGVEKVDQVNRVQQNQIDTLDQEYEYLDTEINQEDKTIRSLQKEVRRLENIKDQLDRKNAQQDIVIDRLNTTRREEIRGLEKEIDKLKAAYNKFSVTESKDEVIAEVEMSPSALQSWSKKLSSSNIKMGFESELIFPVKGGYSESMSTAEPDYSHNIAIKSIDDIEEWFINADSYTRREKAAINKLGDDFEDWGKETKYVYAQDDSLQEEFRAHRKKLWTRNKEELIGNALESRGYSEEEISDIIDDAQNSNAFSEASAVAKDKFDAKTEKMIENSDLDFIDFIEENVDLSFDGFLQENNVESVKDFCKRYKVDWPYYIEDRYYTEYSVSAAKNLADSLKQTLGVNVEVFLTYHSETKDKDKWYFEPDGSIDVDIGAKEGLPVEIVSPPMSLPEGLKKMEEFFKWVNRENGYTNATTGFHVSVSTFANYKLDYVKLVLFLGDEWVLKQFKREFNNYAKRNLKDLKASLTAKAFTENMLTTFLEQMRMGALNDASKLLALRNPDRTYVINVNPKYVEFRAAGNAGYNDLSKLEELKNTVLRYAMAYEIATNPDAYREEYAKRLYKLFADTFSSFPSSIDLFANYSAGLLTKDDLKKSIKMLARSDLEGQITAKSAAILYINTAIETIQELLKTEFADEDKSQEQIDALKDIILDLNALRNDPDLDISNMRLEVDSIFGARRKSIVPSVKSQILSKIDNAYNSYIKGKSQ